MQCADPRIGASTVEGEPPTMCKEHTVREIEVSTAAVRFRSPSFGCPWRSVLSESLLRCVQVILWSVGVLAACILFCVCRRVALYDK